MDILNSDAKMHIKRSKAVKTGRVLVSDGRFFSGLISTFAGLILPFISILHVCKISCTKLLYIADTCNDLRIDIITSYANSI